MALDVTVAGASSDAYVTVLQVDDYAELSGSAAWGVLAEGAKENYIKRATKVIDRYYFEGVKYDRHTVTAGQPVGQRLQFPRHMDIDGQGDPYLDADLVEACSAVAVALSEGVSEGAAGSTSLKRFKAGTVEVEFDISEGGIVASSTDQIVRDILGHRMAVGVRTV